MKKISLILIPALFLGVALAEDSSSPSLKQQVKKEHKAVEHLKAYHPGEKREGWDFSTLSKVPIQSGGRIKPFDTFARDVTVFVTGKKTYQSWEPVELLLSWISAPNEWYQKPLIKISNPEVKRQLLLEEGQKRFTPGELFSSPVLVQYANEYGKQSTREEDLGREPRDRDLRKVFGSLRTYRDVISGAAWTVVPQKSPNRWHTLGLDENGQFRKYPKGSNEDQIRSTFASIIRAYYSGDQQQFESSSERIRGIIEKSVPEWIEEGVEVDAAYTTGRLSVLVEYYYNRLDPFFVSWVIYLIASLFWVLSMAVKGPKQRIFTSIAIWTTAIGFLLHTVGFGLRAYVAGRPPVTNMYESVIWVAYGAILFAAWIAWRTRQKVVIASSTAVAGFLLVAADVTPTVMDPSIQPLVPVLRSNYWLTIHVLTITLGYAAFAVSLGIGNVTLFQYMKKKTQGISGAFAKKVRGLNDLTYRAMQIGVVLLAAGTILGGVWADESWGRFWGWDPKEVWALIALLCYLVILHGRFAGWVGQFGFAVLAVICFLSVVMAWYGVNFVLGAGLHSYGFSQGGASTVGIFVLIQLAFVSLAAMRKKQSA